MNEASPSPYDFIVVGAGPVGMFAALAVAQTGASVYICDPSATSAGPSNKRMPISLRHTSQILCNKLGVWDAIEPFATPMTDLVIRHSKHFGCLHLNSATSDLPALGYSVPAATLARSLQDAVTRNTFITWKKGVSIDLIEPRKTGFTCRLSSGSTLQARRLLVCDGAKSATCEKLGSVAQGYQHAFTSQVEHIKTQFWKQGHAWQIITPNAILGLIPCAQNEGYLIRTSLKDKIQSDSLDELLCNHIGTIEQSKLCATIPSILQTRSSSIAPGIIALGNAALSMPPVGAQGLNMALETIASLQSWQERAPWQAYDPMEWQRAWQLAHDERLSSGYTWMSKIWDQVGSEKPWYQAQQALAWAWLGCSASGHDFVMTKGQGIQVGSGT